MAPAPRKRVNSAEGPDASIRARASWRTLRRLGYDAKLEAEAFRRLGRRQIGRTREAFGGLARGLRADLDAEETRLTAQLLLDVLQRVNDAIRFFLPDPTRYHAARIWLIAELGHCPDVRVVGERFRAALDALLEEIEPETRTAPDLVDRAARIIERRSRGPLSLSAVAEALAISPSHLSRVFKQRTGRTLTGEIQRVRLDRAKRLLAASSYRISEIAYMVGYQTYRDFHRNFVKYVGTAPSAYRSSSKPRP
jgi:AraC-like DNA-binding protein